MFPRLAFRLWSSFSAAGLLLGTLLFAISLTPSLVPRPFALQVVLSGLALAVGYGVGVWGRWLWDFMELPHLPQRAGRYLKLVLAALSIAIALLFLIQAAGWQNAVRLTMGLEPLDGTRPVMLGMLAFALFIGIIAVARLFLFVARRLIRILNPFVPRRIAIVIGSTATLTLFWLLIEGMVTRLVLDTFEVSFQQLDSLMDPDLPEPELPALAGSSTSLIGWHDLGRQGRRYISGAPDREELEDFFGSDAQLAEPVRVYVGLASAESVEERAELALEELIRTGAFERELLVVATPTGTGWVDPGAIDSVEYLHRGDVASVAIQYSYLPSWLTLLTRPEHGTATARHLFQAVYRHWSTLDPGNRPRLYLHGLSLGAMSSEQSVDFWDIVGDPIQGALWSGPPFRSPSWQWVTRNRNEGSPAWLPEFRDASLIRFANQEQGAGEQGDRWGPLRIVYLQYASDPITFFQPQSFYREPEWMQPPRGPDVSERLRWFPIVTFMQLAADIAAADAAPTGHGHRYATEHYIEAWYALTDPPGWQEPDLARLKADIGDLDEDAP